MIWGFHHLYQVCPMLLVAWSSHTLICRHITEDLTEMQILIDLVWNGAWDSAFCFTSSQVMLMFLVNEPLFEGREVGVLTWEGFWRLMWTWQEGVLWLIGDVCTVFGLYSYTFTFLVEVQSCSTAFCQWGTEGAEKRRDFHKVMQLVSDRPLTSRAVVFPVPAERRAFCKMVARVEGRSLFSTAFHVHFSHAKHVAFLSL